MASVSALIAFLDALVADDAAAATALVSPSLVREVIESGASRQAATSHFIPGLGCYAYAGDTALHFAAAAWRPDLVLELVAAGADIAAVNRLGATPLHYASAGNPDAPRWDPTAQAATIAALAAAGADPNARDRNGATPLHRAVRTRCAAAVRALLEAGADPNLATKNGSSPAHLATVTSGRGGSGSPAAKAEQAEIVRLFEGLGTPV
jgi:hypothetical protein